MNTYLKNLIILCKIYCVLTVFVGVYCKTNENVELLLEVLSKAEEDANLTVIDISQGGVVSPDYHNEDVYLNTTELATKNGYEVVEHSPITEDGYILKLIQIVGDGPIVFLMHGTLGSSDDFVVSGQDKALAYLFADAGYDVWLGNARGNKYSRNHISLGPQSRTFWNFSWHEIGVYDVPAMVDHALMDRTATELTYIGHGQGTTVFFVLNSEKPEYNEKFNLMISLGTIAWTWHVKSPILQALASIPDSEFESLENLGFYEIFPDSTASRFINSKICCSTRVGMLTCITALFNIVGFDYSQIDYDTACVKLTHFPSGSSLRQVQHFVQLIRSGEFAQFDFGREGNLAAYKSPTPPPYNVERITAPVAAFYCDNDLVSTLDDTVILIQRLNNVQKVRRVPHEKCNHFDFIWGKDMDQLLYWKIIDIVDETNECNKRGLRCANANRTESNNKIEN